MAHHPNESTELADIPPAAYRNDSAIARARVWLPIAALATAAAFWGAEYFGRGEVRYSPAPLAQMHATWDDRCAVCHVDSRPLGGHNWAAQVTGQTHVADAQCQKCHAGPAHHANERPGDVPGCAQCHREHHGRHANLTQVADDLCTSCHHDLARHVASESETTFQDVFGFGAGAHPEFRLLRNEAKDPGTIAFNHQLHLSAGLSKVADPATPFTLAQIPPAYRAQYQAFVQTDGAIKLDCAACHQADARDTRTNAEAVAGLPQNAVLPARGDGAPMQPILYERHCQACHPLTIKRAAESGAEAGAITVRHRLQPGELREVLRGHYTRQFFAGKLNVDPTVLKLPLPGKNPDRANATRTAAARIEDHVRIDARLLLGPSTCQKCHPALEANERLIPPAQISQVWLEHAKFSHAAHRAVVCVECHGGARDSQVSADVLLPGIQTCQACHAPSTRADGQARGGARFDCAECHRYHMGDHPLQGVGAAARQPASGRRVDMKEFLAPGR